jgi:hypothetical protein
MIVYTIGNTESYESVLKSTPGDAYKVGKRDDYEGGWIWETPEKAQTFIDSPAFLKVEWGDNKPRAPQNFSVYKVELVNGWKDISPVPGEDGVYNLLVDSKFSK